MPLPLGPLRNSALFSNHWLEKRLANEPEWNDLRPQAQAALDVLEALWSQQRPRVEKYGDEQGMEEAFIQPVLQALGWKLKYQTFLRGDDRPDYALFVDDQSFDAALAAGRNSPDFWKHPAILAEAKAWDRSLDRPAVVRQKREYPPEQIRRYLLNSELPFAILTNGRLWRLIPRQHSPEQPRFETYLECNLADLLDLAAGKSSNKTDGRLFEPLDLFLRFYLFFGPAGFVSIAGRTPLVERALKGSSEYRLGVGEGLKDRVFKALEICIEGLLAHAPNKLDPRTDMAACRANAFTLLYRLLFIMYAEDRALLPYRINLTYTANRSLGRHRDEIASRLDKVATHGPAADYPAGSTALWEDLGNLFDLIDNGRKTYGVPAYNGGLFNPDEHPFLVETVVPDRYLARVIDQLSRTPEPGLGLARVDYRDLAIQHLGSIYEGLLELHPNYATEPVVVIARKGRQDGEERTQPSSAPLPRGFEIVAEYRPGQVYLLNNKGERRASGSYYTPNHIVDYNVEKTLGPICRRIDQQLQSELAKAEEAIKGTRNSRREAIQAQINKLATDFHNRVLALRVCDPAMGSGHFLLRVCQYLAEEIATNPRSGDPEAGKLTAEESILTYWKRRIVEHCVYGVDLNPVAVELAKLALWLETAAIDRPLTFLDHHLRYGNSLVGADVLAVGALHGEKIPARGLMATQVAVRLPTMLKALADIAAMPSEEVKQVKDKEELYRKVLEPSRRPLLLAADAWCSKFFLPTGKGITQDDYQGLLNVLDSPAKLEKLVREPPMSAFIAVARSDSVNCFHWQLEFPEVFFGPNGPREGGGFDAIVGNPPWGHAEQLSVLRLLEIYTSVADDHSEAFICLAVQLVKVEGGRIGMVLPDTVLSPAKKEIRRLMLSGAKTAEIMNIGPDWFSRKVRMSTVLWEAERTLEKPHDYQFHSCVLPITTRKTCQAGNATLDSAIAMVKRTVSASECQTDADVAVPLFGSDDAVAIMGRLTSNARTLAEVCEHGRGVELNKTGNVIRCPKCGMWDAPPLRNEQGSFSNKNCTHCGTTYPVTTETPQRVLVASAAPAKGQSRPYVDGDSIKRYSRPALQWLDISAAGINYKPETLYRSPKILIRQAGIGVSAILDDRLSAYCPQSVYVYRVLPEYREQGFDEIVLLSLLCSRLFHLQAFMGFGEIDSSRAFSKLTHTRLARMRTVAPDIIKRYPKQMTRIRRCVEELCSDHQTERRDQLDWDIEGCWSLAWQLSAEDIRCIMLNFSHVHQNETMEALFPGGMAEGVEPWVRKWLEAIERVRHC